MHRLNKEKVLLAFAVASLILFAFTLLVTTNTITNVSAVEASGVGVYWDSNCAKRISSIDWGTLTPESTKSIVVYIRNEVEERIYLIMSTTNWNPSKASDYITLRWNYTGRQINPGETLQITLTLSISRQIQGITSFSFNILITGGTRLPGDVNGDGKVDWEDLEALGRAYGSKPGDPNWNPEADFDANGAVNSRDLGILGANYGQYYS
ncbi:MAG: dockerin type I domain-containing protein [Candidatus Bathyarchaeaceae archaeon]